MAASKSPPHQGKHGGPRPYLFLVAIAILLLWVILVTVGLPFSGFDDVFDGTNRPRDTTSSTPSAEQQPEQQRLWQDNEMCAMAPGFFQRVLETPAGQGSAAGAQQTTPGGLSIGAQPCPNGDVLLSVMRQGELGRVFWVPYASRKRPIPRPQATASSGALRISDLGAQNQNSAQNQSRTQTPSHPQPRSQAASPSLSEPRRNAAGHANPIMASAPEQTAFTVRCQKRMKGTPRRLVRVIMTAKTCHREWIDTTTGLVLRRETPACDKADCGP